jgi:tripartite ATP-independent transporter DctM subunit
MLMISLMVVTHFISKRRGYKPVRPKMASLLDVLKAVRDAGWALTVPILVIFGLRYGIFTPTEAGAVIAMYSMFVGFFIHRELKVAHLWAIISESALATATVMIIICAADAFGFYMTLERIAAHAASALSSVTTNPLLMLAMISLLLLLIGMFLESVAALILLTPILAPIGVAVGIDPVHLGLVVVLILTIGAITPPVGTLMFISCGILGVTIEQFTRAVLPLLAAQLVVVALLVCFPELVLTIPNWSMGVGR